MDKDILAFVSHKYNCDYLEPIWHQGPCDCGLHALLDKLMSTGLSAHVKSTISLMTLYTMSEICPDLLASWESYSKKKLPDELYMCKKCGHSLAEKQPDTQGWDGFCHNCGMIGQNQVGELVFSLHSNTYSVRKR